MEALNDDVLVVNKFGFVLGVTTVKDAFVKLAAERVVVIDQDYIEYDWESWLRQPASDSYVKSARLIVAVPEIIKVTEYDKIPIFEVTYSRIKLLKRDNFTCQYCGKKERMADLEVDHILPKSRGGKTTWKNCVASCHICNSKKKNRTPKEAGMKLLKRPEKPTAKILVKSYQAKKKSWKVFIEKL